MKASAPAIGILLTFLFSASAIARQSRSAKKTPKTVPQADSDMIVHERVPENSGPWPTIDIYSVNEDGINDRALTHDGHSHSPSWSDQRLEISL